MGLIGLGAINSWEIKFRMSDTQIVIPMSGYGERFRRAGYDVPKPLIEVEGKPIIAHVIDMFPNESDFLFICNQDHLDSRKYALEKTLNRYCPSGKIASVKPHKLGPVHAVLQSKKFINSQKPVVVNYCDFTCYWQWDKFLNFVNDLQCDGAIPAYKGFHPHSLGNTFYAYLNEKNGWVSDVREKEPFTDKPMEEYASSGTYYFSSGQLMIKSFDEMVNQDLRVGGEYYVSLAYKSLLEQRKRIAVYPIQHFMQWGTPEDFEEYLDWSNIYRSFLEPEKKEKVQGAVIIPMAGEGARFRDAGYKTPKPFIPIDGSFMVEKAANYLPNVERHIFVARNGMKGLKESLNTLRRSYPNAIMEVLSKTTEGQASTALSGLSALQQVYSDSDSEPVTIGACDNACIYNHDLLKELIDDEEIDVLVWVKRGHASAIRYPEMFGWVASDMDSRVKNISVKKPLDDPRHDPIVTGTFTFKNPRHFRKSVDSMIDRSGKINGEYYIDECINDAISMGLRCYMFEVDHYISWGTPNDLETYRYWQSCFHKWASHPYLLESDSQIDPSSISSLSYVMDQKLTR